MTSFPAAPGAGAIQLYYRDAIDDREGFEFIYVKIKVLNEKGVKHADVQLFVPPEYHIRDLKARTIHPDGKIVEFSGKPMEKVVFKTRGVKLLAKTFTFPEVTVGSVIEYKYRLERGNSIPDNEWIVQHELYTVKETFRMRSYQGRLIDAKGQEGPAQVSAVFSRLPGSLRPKLKGESYEMEVENMPAFEPEEYMPPEESYKPHVRFFYAVDQTTIPDKFWEDVGRHLSEQVEHFIGNSGEVREAAAQAIGGETDPEKKLRKLYARAQQVRNLSYERERTAEELKKENLKDSDSAANVLKRGYAYRNGIVRLFAALARAEGFDVSVLAVSNRSERFFEKGVLSSNQIADEMVAVKLNGKDVYLDPGTKYCPYGLLRWNHSDTVALRLDKKGGTFLTVPSASYKDAYLQRNANMEFTQEGVLKGTIAVSFNGVEALEHRLDALETDEAGRSKQMEDELAGWLPMGANIKLKESSGWETPETPVTAVYQVEVPGFASVVGKRVLMPSCLFQVKQKDAFKHSERKYPVYFAYAFSEFDNVQIKLPEGYTSDGGPQHQTERLPYAMYEIAGKFDAGKLITQRQLLVNGIYFDVAHYPEVKAFFGKVQSGDEQPFIVQAEHPTNAEMRN